MHRSVPAAQSPHASARRLAEVQAATGPQRRFPQADRQAVAHRISQSGKSAWRALSSSITVRSAQIVRDTRTDADRILRLPQNVPGLMIPGRNLGNLSFDASR